MLLQIVLSLGAMKSQSLHCPALSSDKNRDKAEDRTVPCPGCVLPLDVTSCKWLRCSEGAEEILELALTITQILYLG